jgi:hypothetical protein
LHTAHGLVGKPFAVEVYMKFNKDNFQKFERILKKYKLQDKAGTVLTKLVTEFLEDMNEAKPLLEDYLEFAKTRPHNKGDAIMDKKCQAFIVRYMTFDFDKKGKPFWNKIVAQGLGWPKIEFQHKDVMPYSDKGKVLFQNEEKGE